MASQTGTGNTIISINIRLSYLSDIIGTVHTRSRRKLNFGESQRFKGKTFFLDLTGYRRAKELEQDLVLRGAVS